MGGDSYVRGSDSRRCRGVGCCGFGRLRRLHHRRWCGAGGELVTGSEQKQSDGRFGGRICARRTGPLDHSGGFMMSLTGLVQPEHPAIARLWHRSPEAGPPGSALSLARTAMAAMALWRYEDRPGPKSYEQVEDDSSFNCIAFSSMLCAALRSVGVEEAYVLMGSPLGFFPVRIHAWTLFHDSDTADWFLVDPVDRLPRVCDCATLPEEYTFVAIWHDQVSYLTPQQRREFWVGLKHTEE